MKSCKAQSTLSVISVTQPTSGGTVTLTDGEVVFTPDKDFNGQVVFTYRSATRPVLRTAAASRSR